MLFPRLEQVAGFRHRFVLRHPDICVDAPRDEVLKRLHCWHCEQVQELGFEPAKLCTAEQIHGAGVAVVRVGETCPLAGMDGLISDQPGMVLGIFVADCCAVYLVDPHSGAFGLVHSGRRGSELGIVGQALSMMQMHFGSQPQDIHVQLSPCIRPPAYEVDFAAMIRQSCLEAGVPAENIWDEGTCTSSDLTRFYSYRVEKGRTGRMLALLGRVD